MEYALYMKMTISRHKYSERDQSGIMANWIGILILVFATFVVYLSTNPKYKRFSKPDDVDVKLTKPEKLC